MTHLRFLREFFWLLFAAGVVAIGLLTVGCQKKATGWQQVTKILKKTTKQKGTGVGLMVFGRDHQLLYKNFRGGRTKGDVIPVASAGKWVTTALILHLVDKGQLKLDNPVGPLLGEKIQKKWKGKKTKITLRHLLTLSSGLPGVYPCTEDPSYTLAKCVEEIAQLRMIGEPGAVFDYGNTHFTVAALVVERKTGLTWNALYERELKTPLKFERPSFYSTFRGREQTENVSAGAGLNISMIDYSKFLKMLVNGGEYDGHRFLKAESVAEMLKINKLQTQEIQSGVFKKIFHKNYGYAMGNWAETEDWDQKSYRSSGIGYTGTYAWIDLDKGHYGILGADFSKRGHKKSYSAMSKLLPIIDELVSQKIHTGDQ